jgi:hypothetical protein
MLSPSSVNGARKGTLIEVGGTSPCRTIGNGKVSDLIQAITGSIGS